MTFPDEEVERTSSRGGEGSHHRRRDNLDVDQAVADAGLPHAGLQAIESALGTLGPHGGNLVFVGGEPGPSYARTTSLVTSSGSSAPPSSEDANMLSFDWS